jgi:hypothetical protein
MRKRQERYLSDFFENKLGSLLDWLLDFSFLSLVLGLSFPVINSGYWKTNQADYQI